MGHVACRNLPWQGLPPRETLSQDIDICFLRQREEDKSAGLLKMVATRKESLNKPDLKNTCECFKVFFCNVRELKKEKVTRFSISLRGMRSKGKGKGIRALHSVENFTFDCKYTEKGFEQA